MTSHPFLLPHPVASANRAAAVATTDADPPPKVPPETAAWRVRLRVAAGAIVQLLRGILPGTLRSAPPGSEQPDEPAEPPLVTVTADDPFRCAGCRERAEHAIGLQVALARPLAELLDGDGRDDPAAAGLVGLDPALPLLLCPDEDELLQPGSWASPVLVLRAALWPKSWDRGESWIRWTCWKRRCRCSWIKAAG